MNFWGMLTVIFFTVAWFPQIVKTWKTKRVEDISLGSLLLPFTGGICGLIYSCQLGNWTLATGYLLGIVCTGILVNMLILYK